MHVCRRRAQRGSLDSKKLLAPSHLIAVVVVVLASVDSTAAAAERPRSSEACAAPRAWGSAAARLPTSPPTRLPTYPATHLPTYPPTHQPTNPPPSFALSQPPPHPPRPLDPSPPRARHSPSHPLISPHTEQRQARTPTYVHFGFGARSGSGAYNTCAHTLGRVTGTPALTHPRSHTRAHTPAPLRRWNAEEGRLALD
jgi:hypothetical protein